MEAMELSRSEYPSIVTFVQASPAVKLLRDRLQKGQQVNSEISDWIQERRRAEDAYAQALAKLAKRPIPGESSELGVFATPWSRIVESTAALAASHHQLAQKLDSEVEKPIREFASRNSEWSGMKVMETNLGSVAKSIDASEERVEKLRKRGLKAKPQQVAEATQAVSSAVAEWDSQAPFVFEKLQAADESRCNQLRDALTRFQTFELDHAQMTVQSASATLTIILDINTNEEIKSFANKATLSRQKIERQHSRTGNNLPHPATPSIVTDDSVSVQSSGSGGGASAGGSHSGMGLKRLGTVLRNRSNRNSIFHRSASPDKRPRGAPPPLPPSPQSRLDSPKDGASLSIPGVSPTSDKDSPLTPSQSNGDHQPLSPLSSPPASSSGPPSVTVTAVPEEARTDSEGYTIRPPVNDLGSSGIAEEGADEAQPQFKVEIKNDVIHEEEEEADAALSKVANTLRAQNTVSRKTRGRRDVRNTMFFPNPPELTPDLTGSPPLTPLRMTQRPPCAVSEEGSDTHSIKSARSVTSLSAAIIRHPELTEPGLSASLVESVSMSFDDGQPTKTLITGEIALGFNSPRSAEDQPLTIRMDNFAVLEKVAPNPAFIAAIPDHAGEYSVAHQNIHKTVVAFKYQVHVDESTLASYAPIVISPVWKLEPHQSSVIVSWKPNPMYRRLHGISKPFTLRNVVFIAGIEGAHASSCLSKPTGTFSREKGRLAWKLGDLAIDAEAVQNGAGSKVLARFATDATARSTPVEIRWEISGEDAESVGSGLTLSMPKPKAEVAAVTEEEADPFADAGAEEKSTDGAEAPGPAWTPVPTARKVMSGKFMAS